MRPGAPGVLSVSARARFVCVCVCVCVCVFVCARTSVAQQERAPLGAAECGRRAGAVAALTRTAEAPAARGPGGLCARREGARACRCACDAAVTRILEKSDRGCSRVSVCVCDLVVCVTQGLKLPHLVCVCPDSDPQEIRSRLFSCACVCCLSVSV